MKHTTTQRLYAYWDEVREGRPAPRRFDIEPSRIANILADTLILERVDFETYRFRLAGTRICDQFGMELRGEDFFTLWDVDDDRTTLEHHLSAVTKQFKIAVLEFEAFAPRDFAPHEPKSAQFEMILLPLVHTRGMVDRCLGAISKANGGTAPAEASLRGHRLTGAKLLTPNASVTMANIDAQNPASQLPLQSGFRTARIVRSARRQFRVYDGGLANVPRGEPGNKTVS